jgi:hypothetical protein
MIIQVIQMIVELALTILFADFISGFVHWFEDTYGTEKTPIWGKWVVKPNLEHHVHPAAFTKKTWLQSSWDLTLISGLIVLIAYWNNALTWHVWVFAVLSANANQVHKYVHMPARKVPFIVRFLQQVGLFQKPKHHAVHHSGEKNKSYCVLTPYANYILDAVYFWRALEFMLKPILGEPRLAEKEMQQH